MKLKFLPNNQKIKKLNYKLFEDDFELLENYQLYIKSNDSIDLKIGELTESIVKTFLTEDKKFQSWLKSKEVNEKEKQVDLSGYERS